MGKLVIGDTAPDFALPNHQGSLIQLSNIYQQQHVLLVFNLGFACSKSASQTTLHHPYGAVAS